MKPTYLFSALHISASLLLLILLSTSPSHASDALSVSGRLSLRGVEAMNSDSVEEDPSATGRLKLDASNSSWRVHSLLEGGWDGTARKPAAYRSLLKNYSKVYQDNTPYLECKELYLQYSSTTLDLRAGIQRFAWGRLDEYSPNDLLNPWDYAQFLRKPLEDRKIGVPSLSASLNNNDWTYDWVWAPVFVPYRLPQPDERWSGVSATSALSAVPNVEFYPSEPDRSPRTIENGSIGLRLLHAGNIEWALNVFHGYDPKPVFKTTTLVIDPQPNAVLIDPGYEPDLHRISVLGLDAATVLGVWSLRMEAAYTFGRYFNISRELWGYPSTPAPGIYPLNSIGHKSDAIDYGIGVDYRLFEDATLIMQAQQTIIMNRPDTLYERKVETLLWANLKVFWMNQKVETNMNIAYDPEHGSTMAKANAWYAFTDSWKAGMTAIDLNGPSQSIFGRYARNDQVEAELTYSW